MRLCAESRVGEVISTWSGFGFSIEPWHIERNCRGEAIVSMTANAAISKGKARNLPELAKH